MAFSADARAKLTPQLLQLLAGASASVVEFILEDVVNLSGDEPEEPDHLHTPEWLPARFADRYDHAFLVRLLACAVVVGHKMTAPRDSALACVGEEIAFHMIVEVARDYAQNLEQWAATDIKALADYEEDVLEDMDFTLLYDEALADVEATPLPESHGESDYYAHLRFEDWFVPFKDDEPVHPLCG